MSNPTLPLLPRFSPQNIIIRMPNWLGDLVMATPVLKDLKNYWPQAKITALCQGIVGDVLENDPHVETVVKFKKTNGFLKNITTKTIVEEIKDYHDFDLSLLLTNSFSSAWHFWKNGMKNRIGYATHLRSPLLTWPIPVSPEKNSQHLVKTYKELLLPLGIPLSSSAPQLYLSCSEKLATQKWLQQNNISATDLLIGINPGAAYGSAKCWLPDRFAEVSRELLNHPKVKILYFGDKLGSPLVEEICRSLPHNRVLNLAGRTTLRELISFIASCDLFLTNDSGPMHIASALKIPLLALFGSTSDVTTSPYEGGKVIHKHTDCSPCYRRECPIDFRCMKRIEVKEVYSTLSEMMHTQNKFLNQ